MVHRSRRLRVGNSCVTRCDLIRALSWLCVKCVDSVGAGVMFEAERLAALCFVWCVVTSGRSVVHRSRWLLVGNFGAARWDLIRVVSRFCVREVRRLIGCGCHV